MQIPKERIISPNEIDDEYLCPICFHLLWKPVECENCQRIFCKACIDECLKEKFDACPLCRHYQEKRCSPMFYALLTKLKIECENKLNGCNDILSYEFIEKHQNEQCQYKMKCCRGCQKEILEKDLYQHERNCGKVRIECKRCNQVYKQKQKHEQLECLINMLDISNKKSKTLEKKIEHLDQYIHELETTVNLYIIGGFASGIVHDISLSTLPSSWEIIYDFTYGHVTTVEELRELKLRCKKQIIVGAIQGSSSTILKLAAMGPSEILLLDSPLNEPTKFGNVNWYLTPDYSFGFAPSCSVINCFCADYGEKDNSENRLSWHLSGDGGYRAGIFKDLVHDNEWRKIIMAEKQ
ncbi:unnamed protein product [Adineta steineri]|uniref:RING-type domain-containing protein n=1 Tax=Adineta steineri TaxID=433720 RepID=A0A818WYI3_9BILA|nr:unnamed protein product [Adineta steineri]CAF3730144.1 unnamed protein product [Adineta steineri]